MSSDRPTAEPREGAFFQLGETRRITPPRRPHALRLVHGFAVVGVNVGQRADRDRRERGIHQMSTGAAGEAVALFPVAGHEHLPEDMDVRLGLAMQRVEDARLMLRRERIALESLLARHAE